MSSDLKDGTLLGMGNPLLDVLATVTPDLLTKYNLKPNDAILADDSHKPLISEMVERFNVEYIAGGSVQNTLRVAQWILKKPNIAAFFGCVGRDSNSKILETKAREAGINVQYQYSDSHPTGTCSVLVTDNGRKRSLVADLSAANCFTQAHIQTPENRQLIDNAKFFYISGFFMTVSRETILTVAHHAHETNRTLAMNLSAPFIFQFFKDGMMEVMPYVDILFGNETEALTVAKELDFGTTNIQEIAVKISELSKAGAKPRMVVITQGHEPVILVKGGSIKTYPVEQISDAKIVDTNGAGDAFVGGFLAQLIQGKELEACVKCAIWSASHVIQQSGCAFDSHIHYFG